MTLDGLFRLMVARGASDLYLAADAPATFRVHGVCVPLTQEPLSAQAVRALLTSRLDAAQCDELERERELNTALRFDGVGNFRLSAFMQRGLPSAVFRYIPEQVPELSSLGLPEGLKSLAVERSGLVLVVGAAGSGKSTTLAAMIDYRNTQATGHILTFEDPIEYLFRNRKSIVNQREIGPDAKSLDAALANAMRQAPDVLFIGEIRSRETMAVALSYALSGHLVFATLHATNSAHALTRVISFYPPETRRALFQDLAVALRAVLAMRLVRAKAGGRVPAVELLFNTGHTSELIERGDVSAIKEALQASLAPESCTFEQSLFALLQRDAIERGDALAAADSRNNLLWLINNARAQGAAAAEPDADAARISSIAELRVKV